MKKIIFIAVFIIILNLIFVSAFYISVSIPEKYREVEAGEELYFTFEIKDPENIGRQEINLSYEVKEEDKVITFSTETKAIETQASFVESIRIPEDAKLGIHEIIVKVNNNESSSAVFYVKSSRENNVKSLGGIYIIISILLIILVLVFVKLYFLK